MSSKVTTNSQLSTTEPKQTTRKGIELQRWRSHGRLSGWGRMGEKGTGSKKHNWQVQNRQGEVKNSIGNGEAKEIICTAYGHELRVGRMPVGGAVQRGRE